jgi:hypothetical protein
MLDIDDEIEALLNDIASSIVQRAKDNLMKKRKRQGVTGNYNSATNTTGKLRDSLRYRIINRGGVPEMKFYSKGAQQYADVIEQGRRPNRKPPPSESLIQWIKDKNIKPRGVDGRFIKVANVDNWRKGLAFIIGRKIAKDGFKGVHYWEEAIETELQIRGKDIANTIQKYVVKKINEGWL